MPTTDALRDLWQTELWEDARARYETEPELHFEIARLDWMMAEQEIPIIDSDPESTWIWSDLHLGDESCREAWNRPFENVDTMNRRLLAEWSRVVRPRDGGVQRPTTRCWLGRAPVGRRSRRRRGLRPARRRG